MREMAEQWGYFAVKSPDGFPLVCHAVIGKEPDGAIPITAEEAAIIDAETTARSPQSAARAQSSATPVDLQPILERLEKHAELLADHAGLHDKHEKTFTEIKRNTAAAIAQMTEGIGDKQG